MTTSERVRRLLGRHKDEDLNEHDGAIGADRSLAQSTADEPPAPDSKQRPAVPKRSPTQPDSATLPVADGHELLGPCRVCAGYWTRIVVRGQKPRTCPVCKSQAA